MHLTTRVPVGSINFCHRRRRLAAGPKPGSAVAGITPQWLAIASQIRAPKIQNMHRTATRETAATNRNCRRVITWPTRSAVGNPLAGSASQRAEFWPRLRRSESHVEGLDSAA
jgi:hypothetical protein